MLCHEVLLLGQKIVDKIPNMVECVLEITEPDMCATSGMCSDTSSSKGWNAFCSCMCGDIWSGFCSNVL